MLLHILCRCCHLFSLINTRVNAGDAAPTARNSIRAAPAIHYRIGLFMRSSLSRRLPSFFSPGEAPPPCTSLAQQQLLLLSLSDGGDGRLLPASCPPNRILPLPRMVLLYHALRTRILLHILHHGVVDIGAARTRTARAFTPPRMGATGRMVFMAPHHTSLVSDM